jgi:hypothetical protein
MYKPTQGKIKKEQTLDFGYIAVANTAVSA